MVDRIDITDAAFGASPTLTDNREAIQKALERGGNIYCPPGTFQVAGTLLVRSNTRFFGPGTLALTAPDNTQLISIKKEQNVEVEGLTLQGNSVSGAKTSVSLLDVRDSSQHVLLKNLTVLDAGNYGIGAADSDLIRIEGCRIANFRERGINLTFCDDVELIANEIDGKRKDRKFAHHGIEIWGKYYEKMDAAHYLVANNSVKNVRGGGIWSAWTHDITIIGNNVENCGDVCIDVEGSWQAVIVGNTVRNGTNAGISAFYASQDVAIEANDITQEAGFGPGVRIFGEGVSQQIMIRRNIIHTYDSAGIFTNQHVLSDSDVTANHIISHTGMGIYLLEAHRIKVINNVLLLEASKKGIAIEGGNECLIQGNRLTKFGQLDGRLDPLRQGGIYLYWRSPKFGCQRNRVIDNTVDGFTISINDNCWGGAGSTNTIADNKVESVYYNQSKSTRSYKGKIMKNTKRGQSVKAVAY